MKRRAVCLLAALILALTSCAAAPGTGGTAQSLDAAALNAYDGFAFSLFQRVARSDFSRNTFLCPASAWLTLGMLYNGAAGSTAQGMADALHAEGIEPADLNRNNAALIALLKNADPKVSCDTANSIWIHKQFADSIESKFLNCNKSYYSADVQGADFAAPETVTDMNRWVSDRTGGKITGLVQPPLDPNTAMVLLNAVQFQAQWSDPFNSGDSFSGVFATVSGTNAPVQYMCRKEHVVGYADDEFTVARMPYGSGRLEMVAIMPESQPLLNLIETLSPKKLQTVLAVCAETDMPLVFPKFTVGYSTDLREPLTAMGMGVAFTADADFSGVSQQRGRELFISLIKQSASIEVDENGTTAGAGTEAEMQLGGELQKQLIFSKPFLYLIRDTQTGAILFIGTYVNPEK